MCLISVLPFRNVLPMYTQSLSRTGLLLNGLHLRRGLSECRVRNPFYVFNLMIEIVLSDAFNS